MHDLFIKYLDNRCTAEEVSELLDYFGNPENEVILRKLINEALNNLDFSYGEMSQVTALTDKIFTALKKQLKGKKTIWFSFFRKNRFHLLAGCIFLT